jgi:hypothetical protein
MTNIIRILEPPTRATSCCSTSWQRAPIGRALLSRSI